MGGAASVARSRRDEMPLGLERIVLGLSAVLWPNVPVAVPTNLGRALDRHERRSHGEQERRFLPQSLPWDDSAPTDLASQRQPAAVASARFRLSTLPPRRGT